MQSKLNEGFFDQLSVRELEELLERKKQNVKIADLLHERDRLRAELRRIEEVIESIERADGVGRSSGGPVLAPSRSAGGGAAGMGEGARRDGSYDSSGPRGSREAFADARRGDIGTPGIGGFGSSESSVAGSSFGGNGHDGLVDASDRASEEARRPSFLAGKRRRNLKDYIAQVLLDAGEPLSPSEIQRRLAGVGYHSNSSNPRSFYNTVFQALQRYDIFTKENKKYSLSAEALRQDGVKEILPKNKTRLKDFIIEVLDRSAVPLKVSEIASRVVIAGYDTDLEMDELSQRVSATLKKYLNKDFDWDSQRYKLAARV